MKAKAQKDAEAALAEPLDVYRAFFLDGKHVHRRRRALDRRHPPGRDARVPARDRLRLPGLGRGVHDRDGDDARRRLLGAGGRRARLRRLREVAACLSEALRRRPEGGLALFWAIRGIRRQAPKSPGGGGDQIQAASSSPPTTRPRSFARAARTDSIACVRFTKISSRTTLPSRSSKTCAPPAGSPRRCLCRGRGRWPAPPRDRPQLEVFLRLGAPVLPSAEPAAKSWVRTLVVLVDAGKSWELVGPAPFHFAGGHISKRGCQLPRPHSSYSGRIRSALPGVISVVAQQLAGSKAAT